VASGRTNDVSKNDGCRISVNLEGFFFFTLKCLYSMQFAGDLNLIKKNMSVSEICACHEIAVSFNTEFVPVLSEVSE